MDILDSVASQIIVTIVVGGVVLLIYFSADIYMVITKKNFAQVNISIAYFTRNDFKKTGDALHFRVVDYHVPLKDVYKNRFLLWRVLYVAMKVPRDSQVLNFKEQTRLYLSPARGIIARVNADGEFKRACGFRFSETKFQIVMVRDRSDDTGRDGLKIIAIREKDLEDFQLYLNNPPEAGKNFRLYKQIARAYKTSKEAFLPLQIVLA